MLSCLDRIHEATAKSTQYTNVVVERLHQIAHVVGLHSLNAVGEVLPGVMAEHGGEGHYRWVAAVVRPVLLDFLIPTDNAANA